MKLSETSVQWLRTSLNADVSPDDFELAYGFEHPLIAQRALVRQVAMAGDFQWQVQFFDGTGECMFKSNGALTRRLYTNIPLCGARSTGPVAYNESFRLKTPFRRKKLATSVYREEEQLYARWGVKEIQMQAIEAGPAVWIKKFEFLPKHPGALAEAYVTWAAEMGLEGEPPANPALYPTPFLNTRPELELFKVIA